MLFRSQAAFLRSIQAEQGFAFIISDANIRAFEQWLEAFDRAAASVMAGKPPVPEDGAIMLDAIREMTEFLV